uniref:protein-histidine N-methyltransferase n=1 Tax=Timema genevievae TaxID=629358 RepID=A0A7R9K7N8_TIMGE|nr:unnamed protein product [Timema genevievae]
MTGLLGSSPDKKKEETLPLHWLEAAEVFPTEIESACPLPFKTVVYGNQHLKVVDPSEAIASLTSAGDIAAAEMQHSDLLPAIYEGGLKIWECTHNFLTWLLAEPRVEFPGNKILDLGCGAGIIGLVALQLGATVHFQDYNVSVITAVTMQNVLLNAREDPHKYRTEECRYFSGDWQSFLDLTEKEFVDEEVKYDFIFTSETIYNPDNHFKLYKVIRDRLKKTGVAYLAAKSCYFGVGGSLQQFKQLLKSEDVLQSTVCSKSSQAWVPVLYGGGRPTHLGSLELDNNRAAPGGVQKEILELTFKGHSPTKVINPTLTSSDEPLKDNSLENNCGS